jgi:hypothetical protein
MSQESFNRIFVQEMGEVGARQQVDQILAGMRTQGARSAISSLFKDRNVERRARRIAQSIPGLNYGPPVLAAGIAALARSRGFGDNILKGDNSTFANSVRSFFRLLPAFAMGTGESLSDAIERWVSEVEDDPALPQQDKLGMLDGHRTYLCPSVPGVVFVARIDDDGEIVWLDEQAGIPEVINNHAMWRQAYMVWNQSGRGNTRQVGKGNNRRTVTDRGQPFCFRISADEAVQILGQPGADEQSAQALRSVLKKPDWARDISDETVLVLIALSRASLSFRGIDRLLSEDLFKDLPDKVSPTLINRMLGAPYARLVIDPTGRPTFSREDYLAAKAVVDQWLGGEVQAGNRILQAIAEGYEWATQTRGFNPIVAAPVALLVGLAVTAPIWGAGLVTIGAFIACVAMFVKGFSMNVASGSTGDVLGHMTSGVMASMLNMLVGYLGIFAITWWFPAWQVLSNTVFFWTPEKSREWIRPIGRRISGFALIFGGTAVMMAWLGVPTEFRWVFLAPVSVGLGVPFVLAEADRGYLAKTMAARKALKVDVIFGTVPAMLIIVTGVLSGHMGMTVTGLTLFGMGLSALAAIIVANWWLGVATVFVALSVVGWLVHNRNQKGVRFVRGPGGNPVAYEPELPKFVLIPAIFAAMAFVGFMVFAPPASKVDLAKLIDPTVKVTDITTVDKATGSKMRRQIKTGESGTVKSERVTGTVVTGTPSPTKSVDICSSSASAYTKRRANCPGF